MRCDSCGAESDRETGFVRTRRSFRSGLYTFCPECVRRGHERVHAVMISMMAVVVAVGLVVLLAQDPPSRDSVFASLVNLYLVFMFAYASIVPHELGHVFGARIAGMRVFHVSFGTGRRLLGFCVLGVLVDLRPIPISGFVRAARPDAFGWRWRTFLWIATGPAVNAALLGLAFFMIDGPNLVPRGDVLRQILPWHALALANSMLLLTSLYPHTARLSFGPNPSDGRLLWQAIFGVTPSDDQQKELYFQSLGYTCIRCERNEEALDAYAQGLVACPGSVALSMGLSMTQLKMRNHEEGRRLTLDILSRIDGPDQLRAVLLNNLAWADLMVDPQRIKEADAASREAVSLLPWNEYYQGTRGAVLVELGQLNEGEQLLRRALRRMESRADRSSVTCNLALAALRRGEVGLGRRLLADAERLDPDNELLPRVRRALGQSVTVPAAVV